MMAQSGNSHQRLDQATQTGRGARYDAVFFDLDGTLRANQPEGFEAFIEYAGRAGLTLTPRQIKLCERAIHRYWADGVQVADHLARFDERGFWTNYNQVLLDAMGIQNCNGCAHQIQDHFDHYDPVDMLFPDALFVLSQLHQDGCILGLVSNRSGNLDPIVASYGIAPYFRFTLSGGQAGSFKPDAGIFLQALRTAGVPADRALYVGDNYYADALGACSAGIDALLIDPRGIFAEDYHPRVGSLREVLDFVRSPQP